MGLLLGDKLPTKTRTTVMRGLGLITLVIGFRMALGTQNLFIPMASVVTGGLLGEWWQIESRLNGLGDRLKNRFSSLIGQTGKSKLFSKGFVTASLIFCVGPMTILGAVEDGLIGDFKLLAIKSGLDGFAAMAFATTLGAGVLFSVLTLIFYQGGLTFLAYALSGGLTSQGVANSPAVGELSATGGILIIGIGLMLLEIKEVRVSNYLPAIAIAPIIVGLLSLFGISI